VSCTQNSSTLSTLPVEISCCQFVRPFPLSSFRFLSRHFGDNMTVVRETDMLTSTWAQRTRPGPRTVSLQAYRQRICFLMVVAWKRAHIRRSGLQFLSRNCWTPWEWLPHGQRWQIDQANHHWCLTGTWGHRGDDQVSVQEKLLIESLFIQVREHVMHGLMSVQHTVRKWRWHALRQSRIRQWQWWLMFFALYWTLLSDIFWLSDYYFIIWLLMFLILVTCHTLCSIHQLLKKHFQVKMFGLIVLTVVLMLQCCVRRRRLSSVVW